MPRWTKSRAVQSIMTIFKKDLFEKVNRLDMSKVLYRNKTDYTSMLANDIEIIESEFLKPFLGLFLSFFVFLFSILVSLSLNINLTLLMILLSLFPLLSPYFARKILGNQRGIALKKQNTVFSIFDEFVSNMLTLRIGRGTTKYLHILNKSNLELRKEKINFETLQGMTYAVSYGLGGVAYSGTWIIGGFFVAYGKISVPELIAMTTLMSTIAGPLEYLSSSFTELSSSRKVAEDLYSFIVSKEDQQPKRTVQLSGPISKIELKDVSIGHSSKEIITSFNYNFSINTKFVITGASGSGKSTLLKAIAGIINVDKGKILVNENDLNGLNRDEFYKHLSLVQQTTEIFDFNVCDNISVFNPYTLDKIISVLNESGLENMFDIADLEKENNKRVKQLSGGELRRLEIARAMFKNSEVILFDEPTSGLDYANEMIIKELIQNLTGKIVIVVTHSTNPSFLEIFDAHITL